MPADATVPADASSPVPPALDQLRKQPEPRPEECPGLLERLAQVPDPRDPRGVRHALAAVLALSTCAVLTGATSLLAVRRVDRRHPDLRARTPRHPS
ncbi:transposase family protein [Streptomyces cinnamoneus]|uniref:transposase family protein n=1 Tax=Streptomyces cinnamoneus TaxID=53446 RepID=UPI0027E58F77|nr:transposase family protein [Streptomyces cinnamoneus]